MGKMITCEGDVINQLEYGYEEESMDIEEALDWLRGNRSMCNLIPQEPFDTWQVRICEADAWKTQQAYWVAKNHSEHL